MTDKEYCSQVCKAKCCKVHEPLAFPLKCPKLTPDNLCSIYEKRLGFEFPGYTTDGRRITCVCSGPAQFLPTLPPEVLAQCCVAHPELLNQCTSYHTQTNTEKT